MLKHNILLRKIVVQSRTKLDLIKECYLKDQYDQCSIAFYILNVHLDVHYSVVKYTQKGSDRNL